MYASILASHLEERYCKKAQNFARVFGLLAHFSLIISCGRYLTLYLAL